MAKHTTRNVNTYTAEENPVYQEAMAELLKTLVPEGHVQDQISFPPYWKPNPATGWRGKPLYQDNREAKFPRWVIESSITMDCQIGEVRDGELVTVNPGERFSMGVYAGLPLERYFGLEVTVICVKDRPLKPTADGDPRNMWVFQSYVAPEIKALLRSKGESDLKMLQEAQAYARR